MWQITAKELRERYRAIRQFDVATSTQKAVPEDPWGPETELWRRYRNGRESIERLPLWLARHTLAAIPIYEPEVERAKLIRSYDIDPRRTTTQPNRGKTLNKFWDLLERSVLFQGVLVIMIAATVCALVLQGREVPEVLTVAFGGIIAYFFASKTQIGAVRQLEDRIRSLQEQYHSPDVTPD